ncbi:MAG: hypothetical protein QW510_06835 [Candidatus Bathyarchaeia archaeon]
MNAMVKGFENIVKIQTFGNVDKGLMQKLLGILVECYERLGPPMTFSVNLNIYETSSGQGFFASHDALEGKPTINIYLDRFSSLPQHVAEAGVRRQAAHSILHGSPEYYKIKFPSGLRQAMRSYSLPENLATEILYGAAMAAKEYAVTRFLVEGGYVEDQLAYAEYMLEPTTEELQAWEMAKQNPTARIIYLTMTLRDISCAVPLLKKPGIAEEIKLHLEKRLSHLPDQYKVTVQRIVEEAIQRFSDDTFKNIDNLVEAIVENIIHKELEPSRFGTETMERIE